jgi:hypothetical protein
MTAFPASPPRPTRRRALALIAAGLVSLLPGCRKSARKPVYPVRGQVLYRGRPTAHALVTFHPLEDDGPAAVRPVAEADEQGRFTLTTYAAGDGAPEGEYRVTVQWLLASRSQFPGQGDDYVTSNYLPDRYGRPDTSGLQATVVPGDNELPTFELKAR